MLESLTYSISLRSLCPYVCVTKPLSVYITHYFAISSPLSSSPGLEYSSGEGTNYPPKFDSAPGKPVYNSLLFVMHFLFILFEALFAQRDHIEPFFFAPQVPGGLLQRSGAQRTGMRMWVFWCLTVFTCIWLCGHLHISSFTDFCSLKYNLSVFCFPFLAAFRDQDIYGFQCGISASASGECYHHQRTEVGFLCNCFSLTLAFHRDPLVDQGVPCVKTHQSK